MPVMDEGTNVSHRILGLKQDNLKRIEKATNTHMKYNEKEAVSMQIILYQNMDHLIYILIDFRKLKCGEFAKILTKHSGNGMSLLLM